MTDKRWKAVERELAKDLGVERIPVTGRQRDKHGADFEDGLVMYQAKHGYHMPDYLRDWLQGICATSNLHGKVGVVVWHGKRQARGDAIVMLRWSDWCDLHGRPTP